MIIEISAKESLKAVTSGQLSRNASMCSTMSERSLHATLCAWCSVHEDIWIPSAIVICSLIRESMASRVNTDWFWNGVDILFLGMWRVGLKIEAECSVFGS